MSEQTLLTENANRSSGKDAVHRKKYWNEARVTAAIFLLPGLAIFTVFVLIPIVLSARYSLFDWNGITPLTDFIGFGNYAKMLSDPFFWGSLSNNVFVVIWSLTTQIPTAIFLAIILTGKLKGAAFFRTLYFAPMVLSEVIVAVIWSWIYNPQFGMLNTFLRDMGLGAYTQSWLGNPDIVMGSVMVVTNWKYLGFYLVIFIAAIQSIPGELYEAAQIDGASLWQQHRFVTLPMIGSTTRVTAVLALVGSLKFFDMVWILTEGGPSNSSSVLATYMFKQSFRSTNFGYGSAIAFTLFGLAFFTAIVFIIATRRRKAEQE
jgi:raffinose/stachyose/melibiose transport system permease protein